MLKKPGKILVGLMLLLILLVAAVQGSYWWLSIDVPSPPYEIEDRQVIENSGVRSIDGNWYHQNDHGLWEAYVHGKPYKRGFLFGELAQKQIHEQEDHFVAQIRRMIPSEWFLNSLKYGIVFFNRNLPDYLTDEIKNELLGISHSFSPDYDFIGSQYARILNYHAAHDIGHALQDLSVVGCSSFAEWGGQTSDSALLIGRNFDFYMGDDFAKDKVLLFMKPDSGHAFASITWAGFMGVVSGMNDQGLTVTLNAAKSTVPSGSKTPISLLAREILQYASNIDEAYRIAESRETFVSESILIGSAADGKAAVIEKTPHDIDIYFSDTTRLVCTNHYQGDELGRSVENLKNIKESDSENRFLRLGQLLSAHLPMSPKEAASVLRDQKGLDDADIGMGNPMAINQLLAHHSVIFEPEKLLMWVSTNPYQLGEYLCYDLNAIFADSATLPSPKGIYVDSLTIPADTFLLTGQYKQFVRYKALKNRLFDAAVLGRSIEWNSDIEQEFIESNPQSFLTYSLLGDYYFEQKNMDIAKNFYNIAMTKQVSSKQEMDRIKDNLAQCQ